MSDREEIPEMSLEAIGRLTDKVENGFVEAYRSLFQDLTDRPIRLLEVGIFKGGSLLLWDMLFRHPQARFFGVDRYLPDIQLPPRVSVYSCDQNDSEGLTTIARVHGPFDVVIDDGAHHTRATRNCFDVLFDHVGPGGYYVIEDWVVGYWSDMRSMGVFPPTFENMYRPEYDGMVRLISEIMENAIRLQVRGLNIEFVGSRSFACFRKAA